MFPILVQIGPVQVYSYGVFILIGGILSCWFWHAKRERMGLSRPEHLWLLVHAIFLGGFVGGRLLSLIEYPPTQFWAAALSLRTGFSVLGAFVGVSAGIWGVCRWLRLDLLRTMDYVCQAAPVWHFFGRLGCFAAGCCYGRPIQGRWPWAVTFTNPKAQLPAKFLGRSLHPAQLYEGLGDLVIGFLLYRIILIRTERGDSKPGTLTAAYFGSYGALRFLTEYIRGDCISLAWSPWTAGQMGSLLLTLAGASIYGWIHQRACGRSQRSP